MREFLKFIENSSPRVLLNTTTDKEGDLASAKAMELNSDMKRKEDYMS